MMFPTAAPPDEMWHVRLVKDSYGLAGMLVNTPSGRQYVSDPVYACPAAGFMTRLLHDCDAQLLAASA